MTAFVFANYVDTTLAAAASSTATSLSLSSSANLPTLESGDIMPLTLNDAATGLVYEIVYVTAISGTTLTVLRAQEGTSAQNWSSGDYAFTGPTAKTVAPVAGTHSPVASETLPAANQLVVTPGTLTAAIDLTLNDAAAAGSGATVYGSASDYEVTVQSPVTTGSPYIELPDGSQVYSWVIPASSPTQGIHVDWDATNWRARTFGQAVVAPATQNNAAVQLGQLLTTFGRNGHCVSSASTTLTSANAGQTVFYLGSAPGTFTLPASNSTGGFLIPIIISNQSAYPLTIAAPTGDATDLPAPILQPTQVCALVNDGDTTWHHLYSESGNNSPVVVGAAVASNQAVNLGQFDASLGTTGYQKLPSGLIIQWTSVTAVSGTWTFPIAFPTGWQVAFAQSNISGSNGYTTSITTAVGGSTSLGYQWAGGSGETLLLVAIGY